MAAARFVERLNAQIANEFAAQQQYIANAAFCSRTSSNAFAVGISPDTLMRPVPSLIWEATREKAGNFSTSAKSSRTNGRAIALLF